MGGLVNYYDQSAFNAQIPPEGPRAVRLVAPFTNMATDFDVNILLTQSQKFLSMIVSVFVDNSLSAVECDLFISVLNVTLKIPAGAQAYLPILVPSNATMTLHSAGAVNVGIDLLNVPVPAAVWGSAAAPESYFVELETLSNLTGGFVMLEAGADLIELEAGP